MNTMKFEESYKYNMNFFYHFQITGPNRPASTSAVFARDATSPSRDAPAAPAPAPGEQTLDLGDDAALGRWDIPVVGQPVRGGALAAPHGHEPLGQRHGAAQGAGAKSAHTLVSGQSCAQADDAAANDHDDDSASRSHQGDNAAEEPKTAADSPALLAGVISNRELVWIEYV